MRRAILAVLVLAATLALTVTNVGFAEEQEQHWSYEGEEGPASWGELDEAFAACGSGLNQSPIDLTADLNVELPELLFDYRNIGIQEEINTGHAIQEAVKPGNYVSILEKRFELQQFHFHSPSEHLIDGKAFPMEIHMVHRDDDGNLLVLGLMVEEGERNALMDQLPSFRTIRGETASGDEVDFNVLIAGRRDYFFYNGSLTTPPCSEGVWWLVLKQPLVASAEQIQHYHDLLGFDNNRPIQLRNTRIVLD